MGDIGRRSRADRRRKEDTPPEIERRAPTVRDLDVRVERRSQTYVIVHVSNEYVVQNCYLLDETLERLSPFGPGLRIEIDMTRVPYADSEALGRLVAWSKKASQGGASLVLVNPTPYVTSILEMLRLDKVLAIVRRHSFPQGEAE